VLDGVIFILLQFGKIVSIVILEALSWCIVIT
jgi:hypothetical protein